MGKQKNEKKNFLMKLNKFVNNFQTLKCKNLFSNSPYELVSCLAVWSFSFI